MFQKSDVPAALLFQTKIGLAGASWTRIQKIWFHRVQVMLQTHLHHDR